MSKAINYPKADKSQARSGGVTMTKLEKVLWHTTESAGWPSYPNFAPQLTVDPIKKIVRQHMPINRSGSTLEDPSSTSIRENRDNVLQIEVVGYCDPARKSSKYHISNFPESAWRFLAEIAAWFYVEWEVPLTSTVSWVEYPASYGKSAKQRLSGSKYDAYRGHLGHQHASGNSHGDPGNIPMDKILEWAREIVDQVAAPSPPPEKDEPPLTPPEPSAGEVLPGGKITTPFGKPGSWEAGFHTGDDWNADNGISGDQDYWFPVCAPKPGRIVHVGEGGWGEAYGRQVHILYADGRIGMFAHLSQTLVKINTEVIAGEIVGRLGYSGNVFPAGKKGSHLHYEERISPYRYGLDAKQPIYRTVVVDWDGVSFPGTEVFKIGNSHPAITLLGQRLMVHGWTGYKEGPGPSYSEIDREAVAWVLRWYGLSGDQVTEGTWNLLMADPPEPPKGLNIKIGSLNTRRSSFAEDTGEKAWSERDDLLEEFFLSLGSRLAGINLFQECTDEQTVDIGDMKIGMTVVGNGINGHPKDVSGDNVAVAYSEDYSRLQVISVRSKGSNPRFITWVKLRRNNVIVWAGSTHLTQGGSNAKLRSQEMRDLLQASREAGVDLSRAAFGGDLNESTTAGARAVAAEYGFVDCRSKMDPESYETDTFTGWTPAVERTGRQIDAILVGSKIFVRAATVIPVTNKSTDHNYLLAQLTILD